MIIYIKKLKIILQKCSTKLLKKNNLFSNKSNNNYIVFKLIKTFKIQNKIFNLKT